MSHLPYGARENLVQRTCENCLSEFKHRASYLKRRPTSGRFCSDACMRTWYKNHPAIYLDSVGYLSYSGGKGRVHRYIMEEHLGRKLGSKEHVHHINGIKTDNRIENLEVLTESDHHKKHPTPKMGVYKKCLNCEGPMYVIQCRKNIAKFCSSKCYFTMKKGKPRGPLNK